MIIVACSAFNLVVEGILGSSRRYHKSSHILCARTCTTKAFTSSSWYEEYYNSNTNRQPQLATLIARFQSLRARCNAGGTLGPTVAAWPGRPLRSTIAPLAVRGRAALSCAAAARLILLSVVPGAVGGAAGFCGAPLPPAARAMSTITFVTGNKKKLEEVRVPACRKA